jgi:hypothetical protein
LGCVSDVDSEGRTIWIVDAHRGDDFAGLIAYRRHLATCAAMSKMAYSAKFPVNEVNHIAIFIAVLFKVRCRCLILAANGSSFMFFAWMIPDGSSSLR